TGADPSAMGADQYDFETIVSHEMGHALGLGHSADPSSTMFGSLAPEAARRYLTTADLGIRDPADGPDALHAAPPARPTAITIGAPRQPDAGGWRRDRLYPARAARAAAVVRGLCGCGPGRAGVPVVDPARGHRVGHGTRPLSAGRHRSVLQAPQSSPVSAGS